MNRTQLSAELRKQGHGRIADLLDAEPEVAVVRKAEPIYSEPLPKALKDWAEGIVTKKAK